MTWADSVNASHVSMGERVSNWAVSLFAVGILAVGLCMSMAQVAYASNDEGLQAAGVQGGIAALGFDETAARDADEASYDVGVPVFRLYNSFNGQHLYTTSVYERDTIVPVGWDFEGIAWNSPNEGESVFRLYNPYTDEHFYTLDSDERDMLVKAGWNAEGVAFSCASKDGARGVAVYRLYNKNSGLHHFTINETENKALVKAGWESEGIAWYELPVDGDYADSMTLRGMAYVNAGEANPQFQPVYRLYRPGTGERVYTLSKDERNALNADIQWHYEGIVWQACNTGSPVYQLVNRATGERIYTANPRESGLLANTGWDYQGVAWLSSPPADSRRVAVYRLYNGAENRHRYTVDQGEADALASSGWQNEGTAWYARSGAGVWDDMEVWTPKISGDYDFDTQLEVLAHDLGSIEAAYDYVVGFSYRSGNRFFSGPWVLDDATTKDYAKEMLAYHSGNCYRFASLFSWLARALGYQTNVISGWVPSYSGGAAPHGWAEVYIDGTTYVCDPDLQHELGGSWFMRTYYNAPTTYGGW